jgi:uroporphyrinogen-III synthase
VRHFHARFDLPKLLQQFPRMRVASIGPETTKALTELGVKPTVEARPHTVETLLHVMERQGRKG